MNFHPSLRAFTLGAVCAAWFGLACAAPDERIAALAAKEKPALLETLKQLVSIESGSRDLEGLDKIANLIADKFKALGGQVELIDPTADAYRMEDTPEKIGKVVRATFKGTGTKKIMLIAHMDTVYQIGMLGKQQFRIDGDKAYGLGIADDKQGVAVIAAHHRAAQGAGLQGIRHAHRADQRRRGDQLARLAQPHHQARRRARRGDVVRGRIDRGRQALARHRRHRLGHAQGARARHRMQARRPSSASMRSTSSRTRSCRCATCPIRPPASR